MTKAGDDGIQLGYKINRLSFTEMQGVAQAFIDRAVRVDSFFSNRDVDYISELEANDYNVFKCVSFVNDTNYIHVYAIISDLIGERIRVDLSICEEYINLDTIDSYKKAGIKIPEYITNQLSEIEFVEKISGKEKKNYIVEKARREMNMLGSCHGIWATQKESLKKDIILIG